MDYGYGVTAHDSWLKKMNQLDGSLPAIQRLLDIMARLRDPDSGCPWDLEQDFSTIAPYTIEEAYEVADAVERGDRADLRDELGDLKKELRSMEAAGHVR